MIPSLQYHQNKKELKILDICFGLGYNTLATLYYLHKNNLNIKLHIYSPEFDTELLKSLQTFQYPDELQRFKKIIDILSNEFFYQDDNLTIEIFNGDARKYIKTLKNIDIVYQDAFSTEVNHSLWTVEYFADIKKALSVDAILTTYSIATPVRLSLYKNDFVIYLHKPETTNKITIALNKKEIDQNYQYIDMELKQQRNTVSKPLYDKDSSNEMDYL